MEFLLKISKQGWLKFYFHFLGKRIRKASHKRPFMLISDLAGSTYSITKH